VRSENYGRLAWLWIILAVGSVLYYDHTSPDTIVRMVVIGALVIAGIGAAIQYLYHHWSRQKQHDKPPPQ
jgi:hypothetical protein